VNAARQHTDLTHSDSTPTESLIPTRRYVVVENGRAIPLDAETPVTLAAKLEAVGHVSPDVQMTSEEAGARARAQAKLASAAEVEKFNEKLSGYLAVRDTRPNWMDRARVAFAVLWPRISHAFIALCAIAITAGALIVGCAVRP
jgi:hypothetical protein